MDEATLCKFKDKIISREQFELYSEKYLDMIRNGAVFVCPTDTIYGLSCDARNDAALDKIRMLKRRGATVFSIWIPSKEWALHHFEGDESCLDVLPGPFTCILKIKENGKEELVKRVPALANRVEAGLRIPDHWFSDVVSRLGFPLVTTSVNITGQPFATTISEIPIDILDGVDFAIDEGVKSGRPSTIINTVTGERIER